MPLCLLLAIGLFGVTLTAGAQSRADLPAREQRADEALRAGRAREAADLWAALAEARQAIADTQGQARALWRLGTARRQLGDTAGAALAASHAWNLSRRAQAHATAADALNLLHGLGSYPPDFPAARSALDEALRLARLANDAATQARVHDSRARWLADGLNRLGAAVAECDEGLRFANAAADPALQAGLLALRSNFVNRQGRLGEALADALQARDAAARAGPRAEVTALFALAQVHAHLSDFDESARLWTEVIERYQRMGPPIGVPLGLDARCHVWYELGRDDLALADARAAIDAFTALEQRPLTPLYSRAAMALARQGRTTAARAWLADAKRRLDASPDHERIQALQQVGTVHLMLGDAAAATASFERMLAAGRGRRSLEDEWKALVGIGRAALLRGDAPAATPHLFRAAQLVEQLRATVPAQELRAAYVARRVEAHEWLVASLMAQSQAPSDRFAEAAFEVAERARVRALADLMSETHARPVEGVGTAPPALSRAAIASRLGPGEAMVEYLVGEQEAFGWLLTRDSLASFRLPAPRLLDSDIRMFLALVAADDHEGINRLGRRLTAAILGPVTTQLGRLTRLIVVPDGILQRLPFSALVVPGAQDRYLAQRVTTSTVGSGSLLALLDRPASPGRAPVFAVAGSADPAPGLIDDRGPGRAPLREAAGEVRDVVRLLRTEGAGGGVAMDEATETGFKAAALDRYRIVHIAAHAVVDERMPRDSAVWLAADGANDGALKAAEIAGLRFDADLVVLAACRTQLGRSLRGEGLLSLARSFTQAGAKAVVASLWDVGDRDTRRLMGMFYSRLAGGVAPDEALRQAQAAAIGSGGPQASPRVWASFQLSGEGRRPIFLGAAPESAGVGLLAAIGGVLAVLLALVANRKSRRGR